MEKVVIYVKGGMVQDVLASSEDTDVTVVDLDTEEGEELNEELRQKGGTPVFHIY